MRKLNSIWGSELPFSCLLLCSCLFLCHCKKKTSVVPIVAQPDSTWLSVTNASPSISDLLFYANSQFVPFPDSPFDFGSTTFGSYVINSGDQLHPITQETPYIKIPSGYVQLGFRSTSPTADFSASSYFEAGARYSVFVTDSVSHGQAQYVLLNDKPGAADSTHGQVRFINLSPDAPPLDIWAFLNVGANGILLFSNSGYALSDSSAVRTAQTYRTIGAGPYYMVATVAGTYNAVLDGGLFVPAKSVITIYVKGFFGGSGSSLANVGIISYQQP